MLKKIPTLFPFSVFVFRFPFPAFATQVLCLAVQPDPFHPRSFAADLARKVPGGMLEEVRLAVGGGTGDKPRMSAMIRSSRCAVNRHKPSLLR